jgi:hypothetical protein
MIKHSSAILIAFLAGSAATVFVTSRPTVAFWYSQAIYDCGIRVSSGVSGGTISGFNIVGHKYGYCQDTDESAVSLTSNRIE